MRNKFILLEAKTVFIACPYDSMNIAYIQALNEHFTLQGCDSAGHTPSR